MQNLCGRKGNENMKLYEIYFSPTGGTKRTAEIISSVWECEKEEVDLCNVNVDFSKYKPQEEDVCIIAVPSYGGRVPEAAIERISKIKGKNSKAILMCVYGNRDFDDTLTELEDCVKKSGYRIFGAVAAIAEHSIIHSFANGRPDSEDKAELLKFAERIKARTENDIKMKDEIPGSHTYREYNGVPFKPEKNKKCTDCGVCAKSCPVNAIDKNNVTDKSKCISCMRCVEICPVGARSLNKAMLFVAEKKMSKQCSVRKKNQMFL